MSEIRALLPEDLEGVARLFVRTFRKNTATVSPALVDYLRLHYLDAPGADPDIRPLVHLRDDGTVSGFIGVTPLPMTFAGRPLRAAVCGALMVEGHETDPLAGARLLKAFLSGPQDLSLSETANDTSVAMWTRLRGIALPAYSMDWVRVVRPSGFLLGLLASRLRWLRLARPLAAVLDRLYRRRLSHDRLHWSATPAHPSERLRTTVAAIDRAAFAEHFRALTAHVALRPDFGDAQLDHVLTEAEAQTHRGAARFVAVAAPGGRVIGAALYHLTPGAAAHVLQIVAAPNQAGLVVDALIDHLSEAGAIAATGRTQPFLLDAMLARRIAFYPFVTTVVHSRHDDVVAAFRAGDAMFNGLAGEQWSRLVGADFD
ncbi:MAG: hypothetical protein ABTQ29_13505 [Siculibacillus sp.]